MNKNDSDIIQRVLESEKSIKVETADEADIIFINTCSVREHAEQRASGYISTLKKWRAEKGLVLGVVGCMARRLSSELVRKHPFIDLILGPDSYRKIPEYLSMILEKQTKVIDIDVGRELYGGICRTTQRISDFVSITRGCNNYCSYCIVPYVRGGIRSRSVSDIVSEIKTLVRNGVKDITLLGQNVNEYHYNGTTFPKLLKIVSQNTGIFRLRFLTSHPKDFTSEIIDAMKENKNICEWFHLPLQSANDRILKLMNRKYTKEKYIEIIRAIRKEFPDAAITTDIIVGFPTETEKEFQETIELVKELEFDDAYMYRYSIRPGTAASRYPSLPENCIKDRLSVLIQVQNQIIIKKTKEMIGKTYEVLFEEMVRNGTRGKTRGNKDVIIEQCVQFGTVSNVIVEKIRGRTPIVKIS